MDNAEGLVGQVQRFVLPEVRAQLAVSITRSVCEERRDDGDDQNIRRRLVRSQMMLSVVGLSRGHGK